MTGKEPRKELADQQNDPQDDNTLLAIEVKASPKLQEWITTTIAAGKTISRVGSILIPLLLACSTIVHHHLPKEGTPADQPPPAIAAIEENSK